MNKILIITLSCFLAISTNSCTNKSGKKEKITTKTEVKPSPNFDWLLGEWKRTEEEEGKETFEIWKKKNENHYYGIGYTMQKSDTIKQEVFKLTNADNKWVLAAKSPGEQQYTSFHVTSIDNNQFISENNEIPFPQLIKYWKTGEKLHALVAGEGMEISFEFDRK